MFVASSKHVWQTTHKRSRQRLVIAEWHSVNEERLTGRAATGRQLLRHGLRAGCLIELLQACCLQRCDMYTVIV
jgi:geranylgeranyl pyrophosphate synthase